MNDQNFSYPEYPQKSYSEVVFPEKLKPITQLFKESWNVYRFKIKASLEIIGLPIGFLFLLWILKYFLAGTSLKYSVWFSVLEAISYVGSFFLWWWAVPSFLYNLKDGGGIKESYTRGLKILGPYIWTYFLATIIIIGGLLLFIIPGALFSVWFSLYIFVVVFEEKKGLNALFRSKQLVKGKFWGVLIRLILGLVVVGVLGFIIGVGAELGAALLPGIKSSLIGSQIGEVAGYFIRLFAVPFALIYGFLIYSNLKELKAEIPYEEPALGKKIKYAVPGILGVVIAGFLVSISFFNIFWGRDIPPVDDSDLRLSEIEIPEKENAFYLLTQASEKIHLPEEESYELFKEIAQGKKWDSEFAGELIKSNEEFFAYFERASKLPYFQVPEWQDLAKQDGIALSLARLRNVGKLGSVKANYLLGQGKEKEALDLVVKTIQIGQMMEDSPRPFLFSYLIGGDIKEFGLQRLRMMIPDLTLSPKELKDYVDRLERFRANEEGLIRAMKVEYMNLNKAKSEMDAIFTGKLSKEKLGKSEAKVKLAAKTKLNYLYKPHQTQRILAELYRNLAENASKDCDKISLPEIKPLAPSSAVKMFFTENIMGKIFYDGAMLYFPFVFERKCLEDFSVIGTQSLLAIKAYQIETGRTPAYLSELVPKYLSEVPKDPFDEQVKYSPEKKIIYSAGKDLKDSGGSEGEDWRAMEDPTFKIEF